MRFMLMIKSDAKAEAGVMPDEKLLAAMGKYNESLVKAGVLLAGEGLQASSKGTRIRLAGGKTTLSDGPFAEAKELIAGFWLISAKSKAEAIDWAKRVPGDRRRGRGAAAVRDGGLRGRSGRAARGLARPGGRPQREAAASGPAQPPRKPGTTRYMVLLKSDKFTEAVPTPMPSQKLLTEMGALMQEVAAKGALLAGDGLQPSVKGARVLFAGDKRTVIDGPFSETKELVAGYQHRADGDQAGGTGLRASPAPDPRRRRGHRGGHDRRAPGVRAVITS